MVSVEYNFSGLSAHSAGAPWRGKRVLRPQLVADAWVYFKDVQTKDVKYQAFVKGDDKPATHVNAGIMEKYRPEMRKYYFDPTRHKTYLEQLGIKYPTVTLIARARRE